MRFWIRELAGWALVLLGLFVFYIVVSVMLTREPPIIEASYLTVIGIFIFRGGIHLLKTAVAARICLAAHREQKSQRQPVAAAGRLGRRPGAMADGDVV